ncbi:MAG TPA: cyanate hydratase, partial [Verrucomicrobiae bacterium]|nr:cyanate hydratase [Verrucomicrobiae bacterium]
MTKSEMTDTILAAKKVRKTTWAAIAKAAGLSEVYTVSACLGENALDADAAKKVVKFLGLKASVASA